MKIARKIIVFGLVITLGLQSTFVNAQNESTEQNSCKSTTICGAPSSEFILYTQFINGMLGSINKLAIRTKDNPLYNSQGYFGSDLLEVEKKNDGLIKKMFQKTIDSFKKKYQTAKSTTTILLSVGKELVVNDALGGFAILFKNRPFVRDRKTLLDLDGVIHDTIYELGTAGKYSKELSDEELAQFETIIEYFASDEIGLFDSTYEISGKVKYKDLTKLLMLMNAKMKSFIAYNKLSQFHDKKTNGPKLINVDNIAVGFSAKFVKNMDDNYECARGLGECNESWPKFKDAMEEVGKATTSGSSKAWTTLKDATKRMKNTIKLAGRTSKNMEGLSEEEKAYLLREEQLLRTVYGSQTSKLLEGGPYAGYKKRRSTVNKAKQKVSGVLKKDNQETLKENKQYKEEIEKKEVNLNYNNASALKDCADIENDSKLSLVFDDIGESCGEYLVSSCKNKQILAPYIASIHKQAYGSEPKSTDLKGYCPDFESILGVEINNGYADLLKAGFDSTIDSVTTQQKLDYSSVNISSNKDVTILFNVLGTQVELANSIIGTKDDSNSLIRNLGESCESQCENAGGTCWY